jgi:hypothetical protein
LSKELRRHLTCSALTTRFNSLLADMVTWLKVQKNE